MNVPVVLVPHVPGERVGIVQHGAELHVLSRCCGAELDPHQIDKDGIKCSACEQREVKPLVEPLVGEDPSTTDRLGWMIWASPDNQRYVKRWLRGWLKLECDVEVRL